MKRSAAIEKIVEVFRQDLLIFANGMISRESHSIHDRAGHFYMIGSMGMTAPIALGVAMHKPERQVVAVDGDGNAFSNLGALAMIANSKVKNLIHIVLDNGAYESTGGQACLSREISLHKIAAAVGYKNIKFFTHWTSFEQALPSIKHAAQPAFLHLKVDSGRLQRPPRISLEPNELAIRFKKEVNKESSLRDT